MIFDDRLWSENSVKLVKVSIVMDGVDFVKFMCENLAIDCLACDKQRGKKKTDVHECDTRQFINLNQTASLPKTKRNENSLHRCVSHLAQSTKPSTTHTTTTTHVK